MSRWEPDYPYRDDEGPEARLHRLQAELEASYQRIIDGLLHSLTPADSAADLFTFAEIKQWGLKHTRKRMKEENDGA
jgi:hypothetical protein